MKKLLSIVTISLTISLHAQDINYARQIIDTLCAPGMHGRGYVEHGHKLAAEFISDEFKRNGLKSFLFQSYMEPFPIDVNIFPGKLSLQLDKTKMEAGTEFLCAPTSPSSKKKGYKALTINSKTLKDEKVKSALLGDLSKTVVVIDDSGVGADGIDPKLTSKYYFGKAAGIVIVKDKLTYRMSPFVASTPVFEVLRDSVPAEIKKITFEIESEFHHKYYTQNLVGFIEGTEVPDTFLVFSAHYDHLGRMGADTYFPGANDNASGTAMLLNLAQHYSKNPPKYSIAFMGFGAEEVGLKGSESYIKKPLFPLNKIKFLVNLDILGTGDEGITVVNGTEFLKPYETLVRLNENKKYLAKVKKRGKAKNSDHYWFTEKGVPSFFIYTMGGIKAYHDVNDKPETLPLTEFEDLFRLLTDFVRTFDPLKKSISPTVIPNTKAVSVDSIPKSN